MPRPLRLAPLRASLLLSVACALPTSAAELTPLLGLSAGGHYRELEGSERHRIDHSPSAGLSLAWQSEPNKRYELFYSHQQSHIRELGIALGLDYLHFGGLYYFEGERQAWSPYVGGGLGVARLHAANNESDLLPSANLAIGTRWRLSPRLGLRLELRGFGSLSSGTTTIECGTDCRIELAGDSLYQVQANLGLGYRF